MGMTKSNKTLANGTKKIQITLNRTWTFPMTVLDACIS